MSLAVAIGLLAPSVALMTWWLTFRKERSTLRQAETSLRATLVSEMAQAAATVMAESRLVIARQVSGQDPPDFRLIRNEWIIKEAGIRVRLEAYIASSNLGAQILKDWIQLAWRISSLNLLCDSTEPGRSKFAENMKSHFLEEGNMRPFLEELDIGNLADISHSEYALTYYRVAAALIDEVFPIAERIVAAPASPVFQLRVLGHSRKNFG